ncbi:nitroreductase [Sphingobacteriales bacterium UPWRP_1]|nr:hypothetical protein B6N25_06765 [Sphingobacteriales bacterium TSM_CSS]PSJ73361.1 nitroreductase [Sphingobacteriales bacterium UPWRP_1]
MDNKPNILTAIIETRRTVKPEYFSSRPVERPIVEKILENATWAPTHGMNEPWHFVVFTGSARQTLADFLVRNYLQNTPSGKVNEQKRQLLAERPLMASYIIAICMKRKPDTKIPENEDMAAVACAVQNMHLTATAYGLVAYWSTPAGTYANSTKVFLGLTEQDQCLGFWYLGYAQQPPPPGSRTPVSEKTVWHT